MLISKIARLVLGSHSGNDLVNKTAPGLIVAVVFVSISLISRPALADKAVASNYFEDPQIVGEARLKYLVWNVFDAELYSTSGQWKADEPFALTLHYLRRISGRSIVQQTINEIRKQGFNNEPKLSNWQSKMEGLFQDVVKGTYITGIRNGNGSAVFYRNGKSLGEINDREFTVRFFNIWLGDRASDQGFRRRLVGIEG